jgi:hypothetical protein
VTDSIELEQFLKTWSKDNMRSDIDRSKMTFAQMLQHSRIQTAVLAAVSDTIFEGYFGNSVPEELAELTASAARVAVASFFLAEGDKRPSLWDAALQRTEPTT